MLLFTTLSLKKLLPNHRRLFLAVVSPSIYYLCVWSNMCQILPGIYLKRSFELCWLFGLSVSSEIKKFSFTWKSKWPALSTSEKQSFCKKDARKNFAKFTENTCARVSSLIKLQSGTAVCLWILRNF